MAALSQYMSEAKDRPLPDAVVEKAKQHTIDTLAAMISGSELVPGHSAIRFAREYGGAQVATVAASTILCGPMEAALVNGVPVGLDHLRDRPLGPSGLCGNRSVRQTEDHVNTLVVVGHNELSQDHIDYRMYALS